MKNCAQINSVHWKNLKDVALDNFSSLLHKFIHALDLVRFTENLGLQPFFFFFFCSFCFFHFLIWLSFVSSTGNSQVHWTVKEKKCVPSFWNLCTDIYTHKHACILERQKVIIMDEQAATCPCRCHCYALKKMLVFAAASIFFIFQQ